MIKTQINGAKEQKINHIRSSRGQIFSYLYKFAIHFPISIINRLEFLKIQYNYIVYVIISIDLSTLLLIRGLYIFQTHPFVGIQHLMSRGFSVINFPIRSKYKRKVRVVQIKSDFLHLNFLYLDKKIPKMSLVWCNTYSVRKQAVW